MTTRRVLVLNGPNLGMLGAREPDVYGHTTLADLERACREAGESLGLDVEVRQTDDEAELVAWLHEAATESIPVVINPAAFTHYSYALRDAVAMRTAPLIEVHLTNPAASEELPAATPWSLRSPAGRWPASGWRPTCWRCRPSPTSPPDRSRSP